MPSTVANRAALVEQARWRATSAEERAGTSRTQFGALLAVIAVVGGIGATALGTLGSRDFSSVEIEIPLLHHVPGEVVVLVPLGLAALCVLGAAIITLRALSRRGEEASIATTKGLLDTYPSLLADGGDELAIRILKELAIDCIRTERAITVARRALVRASWALGVGLLLGVIVSGTLIASTNNPTQTRLVSSPDLRKNPIVVQAQLVGSINLSKNPIAVRARIAGSSALSKHPIVILLRR